MMKEVHGQCHCATITLTITGEQKHAFLCFCDDCRKINGGGRLTGVVFQKDDLAVSEKAQEYTYEGGTGHITLFFCALCSTPLYAYPHAYAGVVIVRANCLRDFSYEPKESLFKEKLETWDCDALIKHK